jgi:hypothetical protein
MESLLRGLYIEVDVARGRIPDRLWERGGLALGHPTIKRPDDADFLLPMDRVIRALQGQSWCVLVLAQPLGERTVLDLRHQVINEMRAAERAPESEAATSPLAREYVLLLHGLLEELSRGHGAGLWRVGTYLGGDRQSYPHLASVWRAVFSGEDSRPEAVEIAELREVPGLLRGWQLPDATATPGPGLYQRLFEYQTVLSSTQLSGYVHFPSAETPGFEVRLAPAFDTVVPDAPADRPSIALGNIRHRGRSWSSSYRVPTDSLTRHVFVTGMTGSGKTNTIFHLLHEMAEHDIPFLVIEPTKAEYRRLLAGSTLGRELRVFTLGDERVAPIRMNPFEAIGGTSVAQHIDLLRSLFTVSFGMWTPLPQILERCLHLLYADRGWDLTSGTNRRLGEQESDPRAFPTMSELFEKTEQVIAGLGYDQEITSNMRAALSTRIQSLRIGAKGRMLDVRRSSSTELFSVPTVVELDRLGDDDDKAFLMGLLLIRLAEQRRGEGPSPRLKHLLIVEEAHRLLTNRPAVQQNGLQGDPSSKAVETFVNLLAEIRAAGQGVVIADQVPMRLAPEVLKNTNLKICHRLVARDDRAAVGATMNMDEQQMQAAGTLSAGEAAIFSEGDDRPVLVRVPLVKDLTVPPSDRDVRERMDSALRETGSLRFHSSSVCAETCAGSPEACEVGRQAVDDARVQKTLSRLSLSMMEDPTSLDRIWWELVGIVRGICPPWLPEEPLLKAVLGHGSEWMADRRGAQCGWSYDDTARFAWLFRRALLEKAAAEDGGRSNGSRREFQELARRLHRRAIEPFPACHAVCSQDPPICLYRHPVADLVASRRYVRFWRDAVAADARRTDGRQVATWRLCEAASYELIEYPDKSSSDDLRARAAPAARRTALCFYQQMLASDAAKHPRTVRRLTERMLLEVAPDRRIKT